MKNKPSDVFDEPTPILLRGHIEPTSRSDHGLDTV